jgi:TPP-dependent pyruvate/acetoin dehydrogenase alpha subunit
MEEGTFWETSIFARSHKLSLVIVVENNDFSMSSTIAQRRSEVDLSKVCAGLGIEYFKSTGAVVNDAKAALGAARAIAATRSPACVELEISTFCQHAGPTPGWPDDPLRISIENGLSVEDSPDDPLFHVRESLGADEFQRLCDRVMKADGRE